MSLINQIIGAGNFELVRSRIAAILIDELTEQKGFNEAALAIELLKPVPDQSLIDFYELNIRSIPSVVWEERSKRPQCEEYHTNPLINVLFANAPLDNLQTMSTQNGDNSYIVEFYSGEREPENENPSKEGDSLSSIKLQRCIYLCRTILMNPQYFRLGFNELPYFIGKVSVSNIQISQPSNGNDNDANLIYGRFNVTVKMSEGVEQLDGLAIALNQTTYQLYDSTKGYYWEVSSN